MFTGLQFYVPFQMQSTVRTLMLVMTPRRNGICGYTQPFQHFNRKPPIPRHWNMYDEYWLVDRKYEQGNPPSQIICHGQKLIGLGFPVQSTVNSTSGALY